MVKLYRLPHQSIFRHVMLLGLCAFLIMSGCSRANDVGNRTPKQSSIVQFNPTGTLVQTLTPIPTQVVALLTNPTLTLSEITLTPTAVGKADTQSHAQIPLVFTFPTVGAETSSFWRPPLYPVPWEPTPYDHFYFIRPIGANDVNWPLARYRYGGLFYSTAHTGIDIPAPKGTPVLAAGPGKVIWAGYGLYFMRDEFRDPYGIAVAIKHDFGYHGQALYTVYGHLDRTFVYRGQRVESGEQLGLVGETGKVSGPHLHFEVRIGDNTYFVSRNPELWISPPQGWGVLVGQVLQSNGQRLQKHEVHLRNLETNRHYYVFTYAEGSTNSDPYYQENLVLGDLPAGMYEVWLDYEGTRAKTQILIQPGMVSFFSFKGKYGFNLAPPPTPEAEFIVPDATPTITP